MPVIARYELDDTGTVAADSALGNGAQDGTYTDGAAAVGGRAVLDGVDDKVKIGHDPAFQLPQGTLEIQFSQTAHVGTGPNTILSRDSVGETAGGYRVDVLPDGSIRVTHEGEGTSTTFTTDPGFLSPGDEVRLTYSWSETGPGRLFIANLTSTSTFAAPVPAGLTMDMGPDINQKWMIGAGQSNSDPFLLNNLDNYFQGSVEYFEISDRVDDKDIPCFTPGTMIATPRGEVPVEELKVGDKVVTRDNGIQEIRWVGGKHLDWAALCANPHLKPVLIRMGSLGNGLPERDMLVSPNHRMLVANDRTALYFEEHEVLVAAKHLIGAKGVHSVDAAGTTYLHMLFDRHEVVLANGAWTESFQPGDYTLKGMGNAQRAEIVELFPEFSTQQGLADYQAARKTLKRHEAALLIS